jgi:hypothetical protein
MTMKAPVSSRPGVIRTGAYAFIITSLVITLFMANLVQRLPAARAATIFNTAAVGGCPLFPANNVWNYDISRLPVHPNSANFVAAVGLSSHLHPDFGAGLYTGGPIGFHM